MLVTGSTFQWLLPLAALSIVLSARRRWPDLPTGVETLDLFPRPAFARGAAAKTGGARWCAAGCAWAAPAEPSHLRL